jgi:hypothetical protein
MKIVGVSVPVLTRDIDRAIPHYEALTGERRDLSLPGAA